MRSDVIAKGREEGLREAELKVTTDCVAYRVVALGLFPISVTIVQ